MTEWIVGGGLGVAVAGMVFGYLLWRERGKRSDAEARAAQAESQVAAADWSLGQLRKRLAEREVDVQALESKLAAIDAGQLLDDVFDGGVRK